MRERLPDVWVLELSSFQLDGASALRADAAALLNLTRTTSTGTARMAAYAAAKARIFGKRAVDRDQPRRRRGRCAWCRRRRRCRREGPPPKFGRAPRRQLRRRRAGAARRLRPGGRQRHGLAGARPGDETRSGAAARSSLQRLMPADALRIRGRHNALNALAALALAERDRLPARADAARPARIPRRAAPRRAGRDVDGVDSFDDSKGTNVGATVAALVGLGAERAPQLVVILGGDGKGQDFAPLAAPLAQYARAALTIGRDAAAIEAVARVGRRAVRALREPRSRRRRRLRARRAGRCGAAQPGLREPRHVPQLRAPRRGVRATRCRRSPIARAAKESAA